MRAYFYSIDFHGKLFHDGTELIDKKFLDFFFYRIIPNNTGLHLEYPYLSPCGKEMNYIKVEDTPFVFQKLEEGKLYYSPGLFVLFNPEKLKISKKELLFHPVKENINGKYFFNFKNNIFKINSIED